MSREKQIEVLKEDICLVADYCYGACDECNLGSLAKSLYNAGYRKQSEPFSRPHEKGGEWISVEERLPEDKQMVLTIDTEDEMQVCFYETALEGIFQQFHGLVEIYNITHWMPLPEPPKKGGAE